MGRTDSENMGSYREFKKALGKVFGELDQRKSAAEKLAKLKQTTSVTAYITEFQTIVSSLDWDEEAKEDQGFYQYGRFQYSASYCTYSLGWSFVLH